MSAEKLAEALRNVTTAQTFEAYGNALHDARAALAAHEAEAKAAPVKESLTPAPLTDEQIDAASAPWAWRNLNQPEHLRAFARAVIAAANGAKP